MITFVAPALAGLAAVAMPVLIHIAHRRLYQRQPWGAMRFLQQLASRRQRRLSIEDRLLLALRMALLACVALALARPQVVLRAAGLGDVIARHGRTAAVLLIDDSASTAAPRAEPAIGAMKQLALAYLDTLQTGDEVSLVPLSRLAEPQTDPIYDLAAARAEVQRLQPTAFASDMPALIEAGLERLSRHLNPEVELVLVSDGRADGFAAEASARWERLRSRLRGGERAVPGTRTRPHLILLGPRPTATATNLSVAALRVERTLVPPGRPVPIRATVALEGPRGISGVLARLLVNGRAVAEKPLDLAAGETRELAFTHAFPEPGSYLIEVAVEGARDDLAADDRRAIAVEVESRLPVLLVEGKPGTGLDGSLGLLEAALSPNDAQSSLFAPLRCGVSGLNEEALTRVRVAVLGNVPALDAPAVSALERFVASGGGLLVAAGEGTDPDVANRIWWRGGDGFLPARLAPPLAPTTPQRPRPAAIAHPALAAFTDAGSEAWDEVTVSRYHPLDTLPSEAGRLLQLEDGSPLLIERERGRGRVALLATGLDGAWSDLPYRPAFVPLARSLVSWLGGAVLPGRTVVAGESLAWFPRDGSVPSAATAEGPDGTSVPLSPSSWEGHPALVSPPLTVPGGYSLRPGTGAAPIWFAVGLAPGESHLAPLGEAGLSACLGDLERHAVQDPARVHELFSAEGDRAWELWRPLVLAALGLLVAETLLARRIAARERTAEAA
jgi:hypothetical protein